jgi:hypothetical protein
MFLEEKDLFPPRWVWRDSQASGKPVLELIHWTINFNLRLCDRVPEPDVNAPVTVRS